MLSKAEIKKWLLENCVNTKGDLILTGLDFSDFDGNVYISGMKVKKNLCQDCQTVGQDLWQDRQKVGQDLCQNLQEVKGQVYQDEKEKENV